MNDDYRTVFKMRSTRKKSPKFCDTFFADVQSAYQELLFFVIYKYYENLNFIGNSIK